MSLRPYQQKAIDSLYQWFQNNKGNPCVVLPTGSGKSHIVAHLCKDAVKSWPGTRILMLTHVKELIEQNAEKMRMVWPNAPLGIYSAGLKKRDIDAITFAGIQSVRNKGHKIGHIDLVIVDECHLISHKQEGGYRKLIDDLLSINPNLRVVGLTATPYRLGHGYIHHGDALFDDLIDPVTVAELVSGGYLSNLKSKHTDLNLDVSGVHKRGGEYIESELQKAVDSKDINVKVVAEVIRLAENRRHWLFFCSGVDHAYHVRDALRSAGISAETITGDTPSAQRDDIIRRFKSGEIKALTNANVLTTGFDFPDIDLIAMLRPTMSPGLYVQMAGRGMRLKSHTDHCLVLDFAGVVAQHGPITYVQPPASKNQSKEPGEAPIKVCDSCNELVHLSAKVCPSCGTPFPEPKKKPLKLHHDDIMGNANKTMELTKWRWAKHISKASGKEMIRVTYYGGLSDPSITEYFPITHEGYAGQKAVATVVSLAARSDIFVNDYKSIDELCQAMNGAVAPKEIEYVKDGKFSRVTKRKFYAT